MQGLWADGPPIIGLVRGNQVQTLQPMPNNAQVWAAEISKLLAAHAASPQIHIPGVASLINLPAHLAQAPRVTFLTALGSTSAQEAALRPVLEALELRQQHLEMLIVGEETYTVPNEFIILQSSFDFTATPVPDRLAASAWIASTLALQHAVDLAIDLTPADADAHVQLPCRLLPSVLSEEVAIDTFACVCHGQPLHGTPLSWNQPRTSAAPPNVGRRCPVSKLALDDRDMTRIGLCGHLFFPGSLAAVSTEIEQATGNEGLSHSGGSGSCVLAADEGSPHSPSPSLRLRALSRVRVAELDLPSLFGHPWRVVPRPRGLASSQGRHYGDAFAMDDDQEASMESEAALIRGLAIELHAKEEALLCTATNRGGFYAAQSGTFRTPGNDTTLLSSNLLLLPSGPPRHSLLLKAVASPASLVPLPSTAPIPGGDAGPAVQTGRGVAAVALGALHLTEEFNPLHHCTPGSSAVLRSIVANAGLIPPPSKPPMTTVNYPSTPGVGSRPLLPSTPSAPSSYHAGLGTCRPSMLGGLTAAASPLTSHRPPDLSRSGALGSMPPPAPALSATPQIMENPASSANTPQDWPLQGPNTMKPRTSATATGAGGKRRMQRIGGTGGLKVVGGQ